MTATGQHDALSQLGDERLQIRDELVHSGEGDHEIAVAGHVERRNRHLRATVGSE